MPPCVLRSLKMNGQSVVFQVGIIRYQTYILQEPGFGRELGSSSPGVSLIFAPFVELMKRWLSELNFRTGDAQYKSVRATKGGGRVCPALLRHVAPSASGFGHIRDCWPHRNMCEIRLQF